MAARGLSTRLPGALTVRTPTHCGYTATVGFDPDERCFHGRVDGLHDIVTFQADSAGAIGTAFAEAVDDYLDFCTERGEFPR